MGTHTHTHYQQIHSTNLHLYILLFSVHCTHYDLMQKPFNFCKIFDAIAVVYILFSWQNGWLFANNNSIRISVPKKE